MSGFRVLLAKELEEIVRTQRALAIFAVLFMFALGGMIALLFLPELLSLAEETAVSFPEQTVFDALASYDGNIVQIGLITVVLVAMGSVARERERGTATLVLSKPISTAAYVLAKVSAYVGTVVVAGFILGVVAVFYAAQLFPGDAATGGSLAMVGTEMAFVATVTVASSCMTRSQFKAAGIAFVSLLALTAGAALPLVGDFVPGAVTGWGVGLMLGSDPDPRWGALAVMVVTAISFVYVGWWRLRSSEV